MNGAQLREKVANGGIVYGTMLSLSRNPRWSTAMADFGLDYVIIDTEHSPRGREDVADFLAAFQLQRRCVPIVRIPAPETYLVTMAIDAGSHGVLAPVLRKRWKRPRWSPRRAGGGRSRARWPAKPSRPASCPARRPANTSKNRNRNNVCIIGIESVPAIENLDNILGVSGIDAVFVGPNDLSISLGIPDQYDHPDYEAALREILRVCGAHNIPTLIHHQTVALSQKWLREGARFVLYSSDSRDHAQRVSARNSGAIREVGVDLGGDTAADVGESQEVI